MKYGALYVKILPFSLLEEGSDDVTTKNASRWHVMPLHSDNKIPMVHENLPRILG